MLKNLKIDEACYMIPLDQDKSQDLPRGFRFHTIITLFDSVAMLFVYAIAGGIGV